MAKGAVGTWSTKSVKAVRGARPSTSTCIRWLSPAAWSVTCPRAFGRHADAAAETTMSNRSFSGFFAAAASGNAPRNSAPTARRTATIIVV